MQSKMRNNKHYSNVEGIFVEFLYLAIGDKPLKRSKALIDSELLAARADMPEGLYRSFYNKVLFCAQQSDPGKIKISILAAYVLLRKIIDEPDQGVYPLQDVDYLDSHFLGPDIPPHEMRELKKHINREKRVKETGEWANKVVYDLIPNFQTEEPQRNIVQELIFGELYRWVKSSDANPFLLEIREDIRLLLDNAKTIFEDETDKQICDGIEKCLSHDKPSMETQRIVKEVLVLLEDDKKDLIKQLGELGPIPPASSTTPALGANASY